MYILVIKQELEDSGQSDSMMSANYRIKQTQVINTRPHGVIIIITTCLTVNCLATVSGLMFM